MTKMRVLHIFNEIKFSGAEIMYANAVPLFNKNGFELLAIATGESVGDFELEFKKREIKVWHKPMPSFPHIINRICYVYQLISFVKEQDINLIHIHRSNAKWTFGLIAKIVGIKSVYTAHNVFKNRKITWIKAYLERFSARKWFGVQIHTIGQSVYENELYYYKTPSIRINNWYDSQKFYPVESEKEKEILRKKLNIPIDHFVVISTGGCSIVKNHHAILHAIASITENKKVTYIHLGSGATENEERDLVNELGLVSNVLFLGNKVNVRDYLVASDLYLMPSKFEGLSIASIEAMACGIPAILYNVPGLRDLIHDNDNGLLIEPKIEALAGGIDWIIENPLESKKMATKALRYVNDEYSMDRNVGQIIKLYLKFLE